MTTFGIPLKTQFSRNSQYFIQMYSSLGNLISQSMMAISFEAQQCMWGGLSGGTEEATYLTALAEKVLAISQVPMFPDGVSKSLVENFKGNL